MVSFSDSIQTFPLFSQTNFMTHKLLEVPRPLTHVRIFFISCCASLARIASSTSLLLSSSNSAVSALGASEEPPLLGSVTTRLLLVAEEEEEEAVAAMRPPQTPRSLMAIKLESRRLSGVCSAADAAAAFPSLEPLLKGEDAPPLPPVGSPSL